MENEEIREKLLYVLRNHIQDFEKLVEDNSFYTYYKLGNTYLSPTAVFKNVVKKPKYFWQKERAERILDYRTLEINLEGYTTKLTKEEYEEIMQIRKEKIKQKQLEELTKLCNNN